MEYQGPNIRRNETFTGFYADLQAPTGYGPAQCYSESWFEAWCELLNANHKAAKRLRRRAALTRQRGRQRIRVTAIDSFRGDIIDQTDAFGWRAALAAVRAFRLDTSEVQVHDAKIADLVDEYLPAA